MKNMKGILMLYSDSNETFFDLHRIKTRRPDVNITKANLKIKM